MLCFQDLIQKGLKEVLGDRNDGWRQWTFSRVSLTGSDGKIYRVQNQPCVLNPSSVQKGSKAELKASSGSRIQGVTEEWMEMGKGRRRGWLLLSESVVLHPFLNGPQQCFCALSSFISNGRMVLSDSSGGGLLFRSVRAAALVAFHLKTSNTNQQRDDQAQEHGGFITVTDYLTSPAVSRTTEQRHTSPWDDLYTCCQSPAEETVFPSVIRNCWGQTGGFSVIVQNTFTVLPTR